VEVAEKDVTKARKMDSSIKKDRQDKLHQNIAPITNFSKERKFS